MKSPADYLPQVYDELRKLAAAKLARERAGDTLDATALVHEAWLRLADTSVEWKDRTHFFRTAATAMRRILVDRARAKFSGKRGGRANRVEAPELAAPLADDRLIELDAALSQLAVARPDHAKLIELRYFAGLTANDAAAVLSVSLSTANRMWRFARAWLEVEMQKS